MGKQKSIIVKPSDHPFTGLHSTNAQLSEQNNEPGNSVDTHREIEMANIILSEDEIKQQDENL